MKNLFLYFLIFALSANRMLSVTNKNEILSKIEKSVVYIESFSLPEFNKYKSLKSCTGFIFREHGLVLTNYSIVKEAIGIVVYKNSDFSVPYAAVPVITDSVLDIAVLKVFDFNEQSLEFADSSSILIGQEIYIPGYSNGINNKNKLIISMGIISSDTEDTLSQASAPFNNGNNGSPILNTEGKVVGIVTGKITGYSVENMGIFLNNKFILNLLSKIKPQTNSNYLNEIPNIMKDSIEITQPILRNITGTSKVTAYDYLCKAEIYRQKNCDIDSSLNNFIVLDTCKKMANKAMNADRNYSLSLYLLATYNIEQQLIACVSGLDIDYDLLKREYTTSMINVEPAAEKYKDKSPTANLVYSLSQGNNISCDLWKEFHKIILEKVSLKGDRLEDLYKYFQYGENPTLLQESVENNYTDDYIYSNISRLNNKIIRVGFFNTFNANSDDGILSLYSELKINKILNVYLGIIRNNYLAYQLGLKYKNYSIKYTLNERRQHGIFNLLLEYVTNMKSFGGFNYYYFFKIGTGVINNNYEYYDNSGKYFYYKTKAWTLNFNINISYGEYFWYSFDLIYLLAHGDKKLTANPYYSFGINFLF